MIGLSSAGGPANRAGARRAAAAPKGNKMTRNLKALGLALIAVFAMSAMAASAASAQGKITGANPFWLHGVDEPGTTTPLEAFGGTTECETATYRGGKVNSTSGGHHVALPSGSADFTISPTYSGCLGNGVLPETITMNGCDYVVHVEKTIGVDLYSSTVELVCPAGKEVTIDVWTTHERHTKNPIPDCEYHVPPQKGLAGATVTDQTNGHITLGGAAEKITLTRTAGVCGGLLTTKDAKLKLAATIEGRSAATAGIAVPISISD
jgi:hypothetical protein